MFAQKVKSIVKGMTLKESDADSTTGRNSNRQSLIQFGSNNNNL